MPPLKVVNVIEDARIGGPQRRIMAVGAALKAGHGIETIVYTAEADSAKFIAALSEVDMPYQRFPLVRLQSGTSQQLRYAANTGPQIARYVAALRRDRPDVVHVNSAAQWRPAVAARIAGIPCVWHLNDTNMPGAVHAAFRATRRAASAFIVSGRRVESYYLPAGCFGRAVHLVPAPVDTRRFRPDPSAVATDVARLPGLKVVNVGNVNPDKDIATFIRVAAEVRRLSTEPITFVQAGGLLDSQDSYSATLRALMRDLGTDIAMLGHRSDMADVLRACDVYVHTARHEASGMAVWEALATGLSVVTTDVADYSELASKWAFARIRPIGDWAGLAKDVVDFLQDGRERLRAAGEGLEMINAEIALDRIVEKHAAIYRALARP